MKTLERAGAGGCSKSPVASGWECVLSNSNALRTTEHGDSRGREAPMVASYVLQYFYDKEKVHTEPSRCKHTVGNDGTKSLRAVRHGPDYLSPVPTSMCMYSSVSCLVNLHVSLNNGAV